MKMLVFRIKQSKVKYKKCKFVGIINLMMLTIRNIDKNTEDIITYIAKKAGGKIVHEKVSESSKKELLFDGNKDFNELWNNIVKKSKENAKKHKAK